MVDLAIVIPCFNEQASVLDTIKHLTGVILRDFSNLTVRIYVYDNNSTDLTVPLVENHIQHAKYGYLVRLRHCHKQGKGYTVRQAFHEIEANVYAMIDGDATYDASNLRRMYDMVEQGYAGMVTGDRLSTSYFTENKRRFHNAGNKGVKEAVNLLFGKEYKDILSGLRVFSRAFVKTFPITEGGFTLETDLSIHAAVHDISTSDVECGYRDRKEGDSSKLDTIADGKKIIKDIFVSFVHYRPFVWHVSLFALFLLVSLCFFWSMHYSISLSRVVLAVAFLFASVAEVVLTSVHCARRRTEEQEFQLSYGRESVKVSDDDETIE
ncbi:MAG: glycosyltransferase family 2 protein [Clostridia bacterium]|nr:glycosyltransferase family 2 protein [Clostridia bacterium]